MWTCQHCGETVDEDDFEVCWRCSTPRVVHDDEPAPVVDELPDDDGVQVSRAIAHGIATIAAHPVILVAMLPMLLSHLAATVFGPSPVGFFEPRSLDWRTVLALVPDVLVFGPASTGLVTLLVLAAARGPISVTDAASILVRRFPALLTTSAVAVPFVGVSLLPPQVALLPMYLLLYVGVRLTFWAPAILVDGLGALPAAHRAWALARGNWWRLYVLGALSGIGLTAAPFVPIPALLLLGLLLVPVRDAIVTSAYLERTGVLPGHPPFPSTLGPHGAVALPGS